MRIANVYSSLPIVLISGCGIFTAMSLINFGDDYSGTIASFAVFASTSTFSALIIIDSIRTVLPEQTTFGTAYAIKTLANNSSVLPKPSQHILSMLTCAQDERDCRYRGWRHPGS